GGPAHELDLGRGPVGFVVVQWDLDDRARIQMRLGYHQVHEIVRTVHPVDLSTALRTRRLGTGECGGGGEKRGGEEEGAQRRGDAKRGGCGGRDSPRLNGEKETPPG